MPILTAGSDYPYAPQLLKHDGSDFLAMVYVKDYHPPYSKSYKESTLLASGATARTWIGDPQLVIDSFTVEAWGAGAYQELMNASNDPETNGILTLSVPALGGTGGEQYSIICEIPPMDKLYPRREGGVQVFTAGVENIEVLGEGSL
jgi:hypothetical protein